MSKIGEFFGNTFQKVKKFYYRLKVQQIATAAVIVTQALKRMIDSNLFQMIGDFVPLPWLSFSTKVLSWIMKANEKVPAIANQILLADQVFQTMDSDDPVKLLVMHLQAKKEETNSLGDYYRAFVLDLALAMDDGILTKEEWQQTLESHYQKLFNHE